MFGETTLANIPAPNGAPSWCGSGGPAAGSCGSYGDAELTLLDLDLVGIDVGSLAWGNVEAAAVTFAPESFLGALQAPGEPESFLPIGGESVEDYILSLLNPEAFPWSEIDVRGLDLLQFARGEATVVSTSWTSNGASAATTVAVALPAGFEYVAASSVLTVGGTEASILEPTLSGGELMYSGDLSSPGQTSTLSFAIRPTGLYSSGQGGTGSTTVTTNGKSVSADYTVTVRDPFAASGSDGVVLDFDTLYVQEITDFDIDADSGRPIATFRFDLSTGYAPGSLLSVTLSNIGANADLDLSLFADVPGALPETGNLSFDDQAEATGRSRFIGHARNVGQVQPLDVNTIGRSRFIGESADGAAVVQTEAPAESREDVVTESDFGPLAAVSSNRDDQAESVAAIVGPAEQFQVKVSPYNGQESGGVLLARRCGTRGGCMRRPAGRFQCQRVDPHSNRQEHHHPHRARRAVADEPRCVRIAPEGERRGRHRHPERRLANRVLLLGRDRQRRGRRRRRRCPVGVRHDPDVAERGDRR